MLFLFDRFKLLGLFVLWGQLLYCSILCTFFFYHFLKVYLLHRCRYVIHDRGGNHARIELPIHHHFFERFSLFLSKPAVLNQSRWQRWELILNYSFYWLLCSSNWPFTLSKPFTRYLNSSTLLISFLLIFLWDSVVNWSLLLFSELFFSTVVLRIIILVVEVFALIMMILFLKARLSLVEYHFHGYHDGNFFIFLCLLLNKYLISWVYVMLVVISFNFILSVSPTHL